MNQMGNDDDNDDMLEESEENGAKKLTKSMCEKAFKATESIPYHEIIKTTSWPATLDILAIARQLSSINNILPPCNSTEYSLSASQGVKYFSRYDHFFVEKYKSREIPIPTRKQTTPTHLNDFKMQNWMICHSG